MYDNWSDVSSAVRAATAADGRQFDEATIANFNLFMAFAAGRWATPDDLGTGYWPTIWLDWSLKPARIQIEIHPDGYEFYQFFEGRSDIRAFKPSPLIEFPTELAVLLNGLIAAN